MANSIADLGLNNAGCFSFERRTSETHWETDFRSAKGMKYPSSTRGWIHAKALGAIQRSASFLVIRTGCILDEDVIQGDRLATLTQGTSDKWKVICCLMY